MNTRRLQSLIRIALLILTLGQSHGLVGHAVKPLKVFILTGQSNMEGHADVRTFDYIGKDPLTAPILNEMRNADGTPRVCDKVWMSYLTGPYDGSANGEGLGKLTAGFGARGDRPTKDGGKIGRSTRIRSMICSASRSNSATCCRTTAPWRASTM